MPDARSVENLASKLGFLAAAWFAIVFWYPARAFPLQSLMLMLVPFIACIAVALVLWRNRSFTDFVRRSGSWFVVCVPLCAFWWLLRSFDLQLPSPLKEDGTVRVHMGFGHSMLNMMWMTALTILGVQSAQFGKLTESNPFWRSFCKGIFVVAVGFAVYGILQYFVLYDANRKELEAALNETVGQDALMDQSLLHAFEEKRIGGRLGNGNVFAAQLVIMASLGLGLLLDRVRGGFATSPRLITLVGCVAIIIAIFLTRSRGGLLSLIFMVGLGALPMKDKFFSSSVFTRKRVALVVFLFLAAACIAGFALRSRLANVSTIRERFNYWQVATEVWLLHPVVGSGLGSYEIMYPQLKPPVARESKFAHSWVFQSAAETGLIGVGLLTILVAGAVYPICRSILAKSPSGKNSALRMGLSLGCTTLAFNGLFEYSLQMREFWLLLGFCAGGVAGLGDTQADTRASRERALPRAVLALAASGCIWAFFALPLNWRESMIEFHRWEGKLLASDGNYAEAVKAYNAALKYDRNNAALLSSKAMANFAALIMKGDLLDAGPELWMIEVDLKRAVSLNPLSASIRKSFSHFRHITNDLPDAMLKINEAVALYPNDAGYRLDRAEMAIQTGDEAKARDDVKFIVENRLLIWEFQRARFDALKNKFETDPASK